eukprot:jgi/Tetstr1/439973/TSEL_003039.t1
MRTRPSAVALACCLWMAVAAHATLAQLHPCNGLGRRYCGKAHLAPECPTTCLPQNCRGRRRIGFRRCGDINDPETCKDYQWDQIAEQGLYDFEYVNGMWICLATCRDEPEAMTCLDSSYARFRGRKYCKMMDCSRARGSGAIDGCHQRNDFHRPTCYECSIVFAAGCDSLYTEGDIASSVPGAAERGANYRPFLTAGTPLPAANLDDDPASITTPVPSMVLREPATGDGMGPPIMAPSKVNVPGATGEAEDSGWRDYYYFDHNGGDGERNQTALDSVQMAEVVEASVQLVTETGDFTESDERKLAAALAAVAGLDVADEHVLIQWSSAGLLPIMPNNNLLTVYTYLVSDEPMETRNRLDDADSRGALKAEMVGIGLEYMEMSLNSRVAIVPQSLIDNAGSDRGDTATEPPQRQDVIIAVALACSAASLVIAVAEVWCLCRRCRKRKLHTAPPATPKADDLTSHISPLYDMGCEVAEGGKGGEEAEAEAGNNAGSLHLQGEGDEPAASAATQVGDPGKAGIAAKSPRVAARVTCQASVRESWIFPERERELMPLREKLRIAEAAVHEAHRQNASLEASLGDARALLLAESTAKQETENRSADILRQARKAKHDFSISKKCLERTLKVTRRELHQAREARREAEAALVMCELQSDGPPGSEARLSASQQRKDTEGGHSGPKDKSSSVPKRLWQETAQERDAALVSLKEAVDAAKKEAKLREEAERRTLQVQKDMARLQDGSSDDATKQLAEVLKRERLLTRQMELDQRWQLAANNIHMRTIKDTEARAAELQKQVRRLTREAARLNQRLQQTSDNNPPDPEASSPIVLSD